MNAIRPLNMQAIFSENGFIFSISVIVMTFFTKKTRIFFIYLTFRLLTILGKQWLNTDLVPPVWMVCPRLAISFSYLPDFPHKAQVYPEHRFSERYSSLSNKPRYMFNNTISQLNAEQWSRTYTLWLPWHQLIHCYLDNCKFLYTYQLACTLTTELMLSKSLILVENFLKVSSSVY